MKEVADKVQREAVRLRYERQDVRKIKRAEEAREKIKESEEGNIWDIMPQSHPNMWRGSGKRRCEEE